MISLVLIGLILAAAAIVAISYYGSGIMLYPPEKSLLEVYPEQFGLDYEKVSFKTKDGLALRGWYIPSKAGEDRTILLCHGWGDNKGHLLERTYFLAKTAGFNLLYFDHRAHGESEGKITTIGPQELMDTEAALEFLKRKNPAGANRLGIFGLSMGASVAAVTGANHDEIKAVALESPFTDFRVVVRQWAWINMHVPYFPLVMATLWMLRLRVGTKTMEEFSPIKHVARISPRPLLLVSGRMDRLMPEEQIKLLFSKAKEPKELWLIPGADHAYCHQTAGPEFEERLIAFYRKNL